MRRILNTVLLLIKKASFYGGVATRKTFALLLLSGVAFMLLFLLMYLMVVEVPGMQATLTPLSTDKEVYVMALYTGLIYGICAFICYVAFALVFDACGYILFWTEDDYFDARASHKHAAFQKRMQ
jgi:hypothetical protein